MSIGLVIIISETFIQGEWLRKAMELSDLALSHIKKVMWPELCSKS